MGLDLSSLAPISTQVWDDKYRLKRPNGLPVDLTIQDTWKRVAKTVAQAEGNLKDRAEWECKFYDALEGFKLLPAGRILAGAGTGRRVTLANCYVMGTIEDSLDAIFDNLKEAALTMQQGGGIGYDFSTIRPKGAPLVRTGAFASGPISFMDVWDSMCKTIMSAGTRRGAMMAVMRCDHPDLPDFIEAKRDRTRLRNFNVSVAVTDAFMAAVESDAAWDLVFDGKVYKTVSALGLWNQIMRATYDAAEPGVIFIDRCNDLHPLYYCDSIAASNPCGEKPMSPYSSCILSSINLAALVINPYTASSYLDTAKLRELVTIAVRFLDNVIDISGYPLEKQQVRAHAAREIGLGVTGLADALLMTGVRYGSTHAAQFAEEWMKLINQTAYEASIDLARERGAFSLFDYDKYMAGPGGETVRSLRGHALNRFHKHGIRNSLLTSIAPTGTISLLADNVSSGVEPIFAAAYTRKVLEPDDTKRTERVVDHALRVWEQLSGSISGELGDYPPAFVTAQDLTPEEHVRMQAAVQAHVDSAVSKTVNVPADISFEDFKGVYLDAYRSGCKGITTYRPNDITGSVLTADAPATNAPPVLEVPEISVEEQAQAQKYFETLQDELSNVAAEAVTDLLSQACSEQKPFVPVPRPDVLSGRTHKIKWTPTGHNWYVTINADEGLQPREVFLTSTDPTQHEFCQTLGRLVTALLRQGLRPGMLAQELRGVASTAGGAFVGQSYAQSVTAAIGAVLEREFADLMFGLEQLRPAPLSPKDIKKSDVVNVNVKLRVDPPQTPTGSRCPACQAPTLVHRDGCNYCLACNYTACG